MRRIAGARAARSYHAAASTTNLYGWNPDTNPAPLGAWRDQLSVHWKPFLPVNAWVNRSDTESIRASFEEKGYAVVPDIIPASHLAVYRGIYDSIQSGEIDASSHRHDLGGHKEQAKEGVENVGQIMWPTDLVANGRNGPFHERAFHLSRMLVGDDVAFDFDMLIYKHPHTDTETPWHQDEAYWPSGMTDKRAVTVWCALDDAVMENGAMWFVGGSHKEDLRTHRTASKDSHILMTDEASESEPNAHCVQLPAGSAVLWHGRTVHYSRGNSTNTTRRTFIANFRPEQMVQWERENGFDHLRKGFDDYEQQKQSGGDIYGN